MSSAFTKSDNNKKDPIYPHLLEVHAWFQSAKTAFNQCKCLLNVLFIYPLFLLLFFVL